MLKPDTGLRDGFNLFVSLAEIHVPRMWVETEESSQSQVSLRVRTERDTGIHFTLDHPSGVVASVQESSWNSEFSIESHTSTAGHFYIGCNAVLSWVV